MIPIIQDVSAKCARIGYSSVLASSSEASEALSNDTYNRYVAASGAQTAKFQFSVESSIDYVAIGAHNIGTHDGGTLVNLYYATTAGGALTLFDSFTPNDNGAIMRLFTSITCEEIAIETNGVTSGIEIGVVYAGTALVMPVAIYGGHNPIDLNSKTEYQSNESETGQFLGRRIIRKGGSTSFAWQFIDANWYRSTFQPFVESAKLSPFFIKWRPDLYETSAYCQTTSDISPVNMSGGSGLMSVEVQVRSHNDV